MVAGRSKTAIGVLKKKLAAPQREVVDRHISNGHSNPLFGISEHPDILVFHLSDIGEEEISSLLENPASQRPATIIIGPAGNTQCMRLSMQVGVRDYIEEPFEDDELMISVERIERDIIASQTGSDIEGRMTAVVSTKGGCGASFLAANLAHVVEIGQTE